MEENNNQYENNTVSVEEKHTHEKHCWKKCLALLAAAFIGGFLATYFVADQIMEKTYAKHHVYPFKPDRFEKKFYNDMDKMYKNDMKAFDKAFDKFDKNFEKNQSKMPKFRHDDMVMPAFFSDPVKVKTEFEDNKFNVIVSLKPFQNDENKVNYNVEGRKLTVFGKSQVKDKDYVQDIAFSQDFILPENADIANISKVKDDNKLIISVPIKD